MLNKLFNNKLITVKSIFIALVAVMLIVANPLTLRAADLSATFGANRYTKASGAQFEVSVYIKSDLGITDYSFEIQYDRSRLKCVSGADYVDESEGVITCTGSADYILNVKEWLKFEALSGGQADLNIISAKVTDTEGNEVAIENLGAAVISLSGNDISEEVLSNLDNELAQAVVGDEDIKADVPDGVAEADTESDMDGSGAADGVPNADTTSDTEGSSNDKVTVDLPDTGDGSGAVEEGAVNRKVILYWAVVIGIMLFLVGIVIITSFAGRRDEKARKKKGARRNDQIELVDIDYELDPDNELLSVEDDVKDDETTDGMADETSEDEAANADKNNVSVEAEEKTVILQKTETEEKTEEKTKEKTEELAISDTEKESDKPVDKPADKSVDKSVDKAADKSSDKPADKLAKRKPLENKEPLFIAQEVVVSRKVPSNVPTGAGEFLDGKVNERYTYEYVNVLDEMSVSLFKGEIVELISKDRREIEEFVKVVTGRGKITSGKVTMRPEHCHIVTAKSSFDPEATVRANIYRNGALMGYPKALIDKCYGRIANFAGAENLMEEVAGRLSASVLSKLEIALALIDEHAELLVLGNVLGECDKEFVVKCNDILRKMAHKKVVVLLYGNIPEEIADSCNRTICLENGRIRKGRV